MSLVPYLVTALEKSQVTAASTGKNIVAGAIITLSTIAGVAVTMFDNSAGSGGNTAKSTDANGQKVIFVKPGIYNITVNGDAEKRINISELLGDNKGLQRKQLEVSGYYDLLSSAVSDDSLVDGGVVIIKDRADSVWDVVLSSTVTSNLYDIYTSTSIPSLSIKLREPKILTPEHYGLGAGVEDRDGFIYLLAKNKPIQAFGDEYILNGAEYNGPCDVEFGKNTIIRNNQTSGPRRSSLKFFGLKDETKIDVTVATLGSLADTITVSSAGSFSVGDTCLLEENAANKPEINYGQGNLTQDANYREFNTILSINGNDIQFEEYLRFPYLVANDLKIQKVFFNENAHVKGGIYTGGSGSGGGVTHELCRYSSTFMVKGRGISESDRNGGTVSFFQECWECSRGGLDSIHTLFGSRALKNQSCINYDIKSKRTSNGGVIVSGDTFCMYDLIVQDSTGDDNGDGVGLSNGARFNTFGSIILSGSRCYGMWSHEFCDDNTFESFVSNSGITVGVYLFGDRNKFSNVKVENHPTGMAIYGNDNTVASADVAAKGTALIMTAIGQSGNKVSGKFISTGTDANSKDLLLSDLGPDNEIDILGGARGMTYAAGRSPNHDSTVIVSGVNPYVLKIDRHTKGFTWSSRNVTASSLVDLKIPVRGGTDGLGQFVSTASGDAAKIYKIMLKTETTLANSYSEYVITDRQGALSIETVLEGTGVFAPRLVITSGVVQLRVSNNSVIFVSVNLDQF